MPHPTRPLSPPSRHRHRIFTDPWRVSPVLVCLFALCAALAGADATEGGGLCRVLQQRSSRSRPQGDFLKDRSRSIGAGILIIAAAKQEEKADSLKATLAGVKDFLLGGVAGAIASAVVFPIDLAKTRIQDQAIVAGAEVKYKNVIQTIGKVASEESVLGLYKGITPVLLGALPEGILEIGTNDAVRKALATRLNTPLQDLPVAAEVVAGACAGFMQVVVTSPMERVKILQQVMGQKAPTVPSLVKELGLRGLYQGSSACWLRDIPFAALYFSLYASFRKTLQKQEGDRNAAVDDLLAGLAAGVPAAAITTPFDVIKTRMQSCGVMEKGCEVTAMSIKSTAGQLWKEEGAKAFFKGISGRVGRIAPQMAICLALYEALKSWSDLPVSGHV